MIEKIQLTDSSWRYFLSKEEPGEQIIFGGEAWLPSTVSQAQLSPLTQERSDGYLTDPYRYEGYIVYEREIRLDAPTEELLYLVLERTRTTKVWINGVYVGSQNSLCSAHRYDITEAVRSGSNRVRIQVDNVSCPVPGGHMTSQDTQTNWLGITGELCIERVAKIHMEQVRLYPEYRSRTVTIRGELKGLGADSARQAELSVWAEGNFRKHQQEYLRSEYRISRDGQFCLQYAMPGAVLWSEHTPVLYRLHIACGTEEICIPFGMRNFAAEGLHFRLNGRRIHLRGKHDGMIFPLTGAAPTDKESWLKVLGTAKAYGINHYRFHTCCPPEAAFAAADELGIYMEPELPFWGSVEEEITPAQRYLIGEGHRILDSFANHPSFFALSLGNELWGSRERLNRILGDYKAYDPRPLYTEGCNNFQFWTPRPVENDDFFVGVRFSMERQIRGSYAMCDAPQGHIQVKAPEAAFTYDEHILPREDGRDTRNAGDPSTQIEIQFGMGVKKVSMEETEGEYIPRMPVVSHEVGQYFMYPDYRGLDKYTGVLKPYNLQIFKERLEKAGLAEYGEAYAGASGRFAAECYKNEIETALRSEQLAGFQLLDLQDFTGQGTALVGVLDAFMESKGVIPFREWQGFCHDQVLLGCLPGYVFAAGEALTLPIKLYTYGAESMTAPVVEIQLCCRTQDDCKSENVLPKQLSVGGSFQDGLYLLGSVNITLPLVQQGTKAVLTLTCGELQNRYSLWIYPRDDIAAKDTATVITASWQQARAGLAEGRAVLFLPERVPEEQSIEGTYCTDFWNYPMFDGISRSMNRTRPVGTLGLLIDKAHPALAGFAPEEYSTPQWYDVVTDSRTMILDGTGIRPIVRTIDNCERNHSLGMLFEVGVGDGRLLVCTARLERKADVSLACRALLGCLTRYVQSDAFQPMQTVEISILDKLFES